MIDNGEKLTFLINYYIKIHMSWLGYSSIHPETVRLSPCCPIKTVGTVEYFGCHCSCHHHRTHACATQCLVKLYPNVKASHKAIPCEILPNYSTKNVISLMWHSVSVPHNTRYINCDFFQKLSVCVCVCVL